MLVRDELRRAGLESQIHAGIILSRVVGRISVDFSSWPSGFSTCRCAWPCRVGSRA